MEAEKVFKQNLDVPTSRSVQAGRPTSVNICEVLGDEEFLAASEATLREATHLAMTLSHFPLLCYANEPISHLTSSSIRPLVDILADTFQESCSVPDNIARAYDSSSPYVNNASCISPSSLSCNIPLELLVPNDGDGIVELTVHPRQPNALHNAVYHRFHAVDAPELFCTSFVKVNNNDVLKRHNGHLSHLAVHYYLVSFGRPRGTSLICKENPRFGMTPVDKYQRPLSVFWFAWFQIPDSVELLILDDIIASIEGEEDSVRSRLMSSFNPRDAAIERPFLLNLNALLVVSGFCHVYTR